MSISLEHMPIKAAILKLLTDSEVYKETSDKVLLLESIIKEIKEV